MLQKIYLIYSFKQLCEIGIIINIMNVSVKKTETYIIYHLVELRWKLKLAWHQTYKLKFIK